MPGALGPAMERPLGAARSEGMHCAFSTSTAWHGISLLLLGSGALDSGNVVEVSVFGAQDFKRRTTIDIDGHISLPLLGDSRAAGLTLSELRERLRQALVNNNIIRDPDVTAELVEQRPFYISGHVAKPGGRIHINRD
jgi:polysaccharide biosynthesis/export protein